MPRSRRPESVPGSLGPRRDSHGIPAADCATGRARAARRRIFIDSRAPRGSPGARAHIDFPSVVFCALGRSPASPISERQEQPAYLRRGSVSAASATSAAAGQLSFGGLTAPLGTFFGGGEFEFGRRGVDSRVCVVVGVLYGFGGLLVHCMCV